MVIATTSNTGSRFMCPITRKYLQTPMKNRNCGHHYSKSAIEEVLKSNRKAVTSCPVAGCSAKVTLSSIEEDLDMERQIARYMKKNPQKESDSEEEIEQL